MSKKMITRLDAAIEEMENIDEEMSMLDYWIELHGTDKGFFEQFGWKTFCDDGLVWQFDDVEVLQ